MSVSEIQPGMVIPEASDWANFEFILGGSSWSGSTNST